VPDLGSAILRDRGNQIVVEGMEVDVEDSRLVASNEGKLGVDLSGRSGPGVDGKRATTSGLPQDGKEERVGSNIVGVPCGTCNLQFIVALLLLEGLSKDVTKLRCSNDSSGHDVVVASEMKR